MLKRNINIITDFFFSGDGINKAVRNPMGITVKQAYPFYSVNAEYTHNSELFGPSFTADTLPADGILDRLYTYIMYEGELYQYCPGKSFSDSYHWIDEQMDISDVTENSFTLNRKFERPENIEYPQANGDVTFKIVFDENAQDWRIEQKDVEYEFDYPDTASSNNE